LQLSLVTVIVGALLMAKTVSCIYLKSCSCRLFAWKTYYEWTVLPAIIVWLIMTSNSQQLTRFAAERCHF